MSLPASSNLSLPESTGLPCAKCGYDLRAQPRDGICPECATPVKKAIELAAIPLRPAWRDSDPRWRRRMLAGAWVMVMIPLVAVARWSGLTGKVPLVLYDFESYWPGTLEESLILFLFPYLAFCIGVVLFFAKERGRRRHPLDWTRRWGVIASYVVLLLGVPLHALVTALVFVGIAALFHSLPPANQPAATDLVREIGASYLRYGSNDSEAPYVAAAVFSACALLLACVPIYDALRCSGPKRLALVLIVTLALICASQIWSTVRWYMNLPFTTSPEPPAFFFDNLLLSGLVDPGSAIRGRTWLTTSLARESAKWVVFLMIAIWLTGAQVRAWRKLPTPTPGAT